MILEPKKIKSVTVSPSIFHEVMGLDVMNIQKLDFYRVLKKLEVNSSPQIQLALDFIFGKFVNYRSNLLILILRLIIF